MKKFFKATSLTLLALSLAACDKPAPTTPAANQPAPQSAPAPQPSTPAEAPKSDNTHTQRGNSPAPVEGKEYLTIRQTPSTQKQVVEFFSFYCPHCYSFELEYKIPSQIKQGLPSDAKLVQYHVNFLGRQSENLTRAWALAMALGVEDKVKTPLFMGAQNDAYKSMDDIRAVFLANGITAEQFDNNINGFAVNGLVNKQVQLADEFKIHGVPAFFVNDQYQINLEGFNDTNSMNDFIQRYIDAVLFLVRK